MTEGMALEVVFHILSSIEQMVLGQPLVYGQSITDGCIDWATTDEVLGRLAGAVVHVGTSCSRQWPDSGLGTADRDLGPRLAAGQTAARRL